MRHNNTTKYESPALRFCNLEMEGFLCNSQMSIGEDEFTSVFGDEGGSGNLEFEYSED